ncbi:MAG: hypothetical protein QF918_03795 [Pirellulaceae bacterium]|nr:hypothetical protein [Pirellulaceae bacterium]
MNWTSWDAGGRIGMHTVELLEQVLTVAERLGYGIRYEWLGGQGCTACEFGGRKWMFIDLAVSTAEQLEQVAEALQDDPGVHLLELEAPMQKLLGTHRAA